MKMLIVLVLAVLLFSGCVSSSKPQPQIKYAYFEERTPTPEMLIAPPILPTPTDWGADFWITITAEVMAYKSRPIPTLTPEIHYPRNTMSPTKEKRNCNIKGNVSHRNKDQKIYHCPNWKDYAKTDVNESEGDRWFCSESEALAAGFRKPDNISAPCYQ